MNKVLAVAVVLLGALAVGLATNQSAPTTFLGPRVVATVNLTNQTESIPTTTIFRPPVSGLYRASVYMTNTAPGNGASLFMNWTDDAGVQSASIGTTGLANYCVTNAESLPCGATFYAKAGTPVSYFTQTGAGGTGTYELFIVIERLE